MPLSRTRTWHKTWNTSSCLPSTPVRESSKRLMMMMMLLPDYGSSMMMMMMIPGE